MRRGKTRPTEGGTQVSLIAVIGGVMIASAMVKLAVVVDDLQKKVERLEGPKIKVLDNKMPRYYKPIHDITDEEED